MDARGVARRVHPEYPVMAWIRRMQALFDGTPDEYQRLRQDERVRRAAPERVQSHFSRRGLR